MASEFTRLTPQARLGDLMDKRRLALYAAGLAAMVTPFARAQDVNRCIDRCFRTFSPMQNNGSTELRDECLQQCNKMTAAPSVPHGAIAFGAQSASWGISYGKPSMASANSSAMSACLERAETVNWSRATPTLAQHWPPCAPRLSLSLSKLTVSAMPRLVR
jgi:hypothetical protein